MAVLIPMLMRLFRRSIMRSDPSMSVAHYRILEFLNRSPGASLGELSAELEITNATASSHVEKLVKRQLVKRVPHQSERRRVVLTLTAAGQRQLQEVRELATESFTELLATIHSTKLTRVQDALGILQEALKQSGNASEKENHA